MPLAPAGCILSRGARSASPPGPLPPSQFTLHKVLNTKAAQQYWLLNRTAMQQQRAVAHHNSHLPHAHLPALLGATGLVSQPPRSAGAPTAHAPLCATGSVTQRPPRQRVTNCSGMGLSMGSASSAFGTENANMDTRRCGRQRSKPVPNCSGMGLSIGSASSAPGLQAQTAVRKVWQCSMFTNYPSQLQ